MNWLLLTISIISMALFASVMVFVANRRKQIPRYDDLKRDRDALLFTLFTSRIGFYWFPERVSKPRLASGIDS